MRRFIRKYPVLHLPAPADGHGEGIKGGVLGEILVTTAGRAGKGIQWGLIKEGEVQGQGDGAIRREVQHCGC